MTIQDDNTLFCPDASYCPFHYDLATTLVRQISVFFQRSFSVGNEIPRQICCFHSFFGSSVEPANMEFDNIPIRSTFDNLTLNLDTKPNRKLSGFLKIIGPHKNLNLIGARSWNLILAKLSG